MKRRRKNKNIYILKSGFFAAAGLAKIIDIISVLNHNIICKYYDLSEEATGSKYDFIILIIIFILFFKNYKKI